jgi:hypothetical protein
VHIDGGPVSTSALRTSALDRSAVEAVVRAARDGQVVVVPHQIPPTAIPNADEMHRIANALPRSWWRAMEGATAEVLSCWPSEVAPTLPSDGSGSIVTRLYHMQQIPEFQPLIDSVYDDVERAWPDEHAWLRRDAGFFLSSDGAVTAAHADRHHNLLVQLSGSKEIGVSVPGSRAHAAVVARSMPAMRCSEMPPGVRTFQLHAGSAIYIPAYSVHWVRSTEGSVALSCGWSTAGTVQAGDVHAANAALLRFRVPAKPVGAPRAATRVRAVAAARRLRRPRGENC